MSDSEKRELDPGEKRNPRYYKDIEESLPKPLPNWGPMDRNARLKRENKRRKEMGLKPWPKHMTLSASATVYSADPMSEKDRDTLMAMSEAARKHPDTTLKEKMALFYKAKENNPTLSLADFLRNM